MNYRHIYMKIITKAKEEMCQSIRVKGNGNYYERHHILPKSLFPLWAKRKSNIVLLTAREHFFCHQLLDKIYPNSKMFIGLWRLSNDNKHRYLSSKEYERLKQRYSKFMSELHKGQPSKNKGKKLSEKHKQKLSSAHKGKKLSDETKQKIAESHKGKKFSEEHKKHLIEASARRGKPAPNKGFKKVFYIKYNNSIFTIMKLSKLLNVSEQTIRRHLRENKPINNFSLVLEGTRYEKLSV